MDEMDKEKVGSIPEFRTFTASFLAGIMYHILNRVPADYHLMMMRITGLFGGELIEAVNFFLGYLQMRAIN